MARGGYAPEIRAAMGTGTPGRVNTSLKKPSPSQGESKADVSRDVSKGIAEGSPQDAKLDAMPANRASPPPQPMHMQGIPADAHHIAAATSIAHAILNRRPGGM
jgi:cell pole-organizing protein PopZ